MKKPSPRWTKAGVRHKTPRLYLLRLADPPQPKWAQYVAGFVWRDGDFCWVRRGRKHQFWDMCDYERSTEPIEEPHARAIVAALDGK